ncbi:MAG: hypothetical protein JJ971_12820 [Balneolaceae bacterium]|nr:hypothetical protein [Balneolaceae bacterium]MBO6547265.1 hypothetical protein [Balneolaceae bacterium]MBO6647788.1 hypothetical protein [Balneolaceae bacterium]
MLSYKIFRYELQHWLKQPVFSVFLGLFFCAGIGIMALSADILGEQSISQNSRPFANASSNIFSYFFDVQLFSLFLVPLFLCGTIYRDFQTNGYLVLYSYPINKAQYISGKFASGFLLIFIIQAFFYTGLFVGSILPGVNEGLIGDHSFSIYLVPFLSITLVNSFWIGVLTFSVVSLSRNIHAAFVTVILVFVLRRAILFILAGPDNLSTLTLLDPFGEFAVLNATAGWTISEVNTQFVPLTNDLVLNRLLWSGISVCIGTFAYTLFNLTHKQSFLSFVSNRKSENLSSDFQNASSFSLSTFLPVGIRNSWELSSFQFSAIIKSRTFIVLMLVSLLFMFLLLGQVNPEYTTRIYPLTQVMLLLPSLFFSFIVMIVTFLYAGFLVNKDIQTGMDALIDSTQVSNLTLLISKFLTLLKLQAVLLTMIILGGVSVQLWKGFTQFELSLYVFHVYGVLFIGQAIWAAMALFVQTILRNQYLGFFLLVVFAFGLSGIESIGIEKDIYAFNEAPIPQYSDLSGYGASLRSFFAHKFYWAIFGGILLIGTLLFTRRGQIFTLKERLLIAKERSSQKAVMALVLLCILFVGTGFSISTIIYPHNNEPALITEQRKAEAEKLIGHLKNLPQPRLKALKMNMNIFPSQRSYTSSGTLYFVNDETVPLDTLLFSCPNDVSLTGIIDQRVDKIAVDSILRFEVLKLSTPLQPADTLKVNFSAENHPENWFSENSKVINNGTFFLADFPSIGYPDIELKNPSTRSKYDLPELEDGKINLRDSAAGINSYVGHHIDLLDLDITVGTSVNQIAITPGNLVAEWREDNRAYFKFESTNPIRNGISVQSGRFDVFEDSLNVISLQIYHHPTHTFNLERMMSAMKATLGYTDSTFGGYPFKELRIVEFSKTYGSFAQSFTQTIPFSEFAGFFSKQDTSENRFDDVFRLTAHELSHQWWGHQIIPADALGSRFLTEGFAEFTALQILEQGYGPEKKKLYLDTISNRYFNQRNRTNEESPLIFVTPNEAHISYARGLLALNSMYQHLGSKQFEQVLRNFIESFASKAPPYPTSLDFISHLKSQTPDSLTYLIYDLFETSTVYKNEIVDYSMQSTESSEFEIELTVSSSKERKESKYQIQGFDEKLSGASGFYLQIGAFDSEDKLIQLESVYVGEGQNSIIFTIGEKTSKIVLDPKHILIEQNISDNTLIIE